MLFLIPDLYITITVKNENNCENVSIKIIVIIICTSVYHRLTLFSFFICLVFISFSEFLFLPTGSILFIYICCYCYKTAFVYRYVCLLSYMNVCKFICMHICKQSTFPNMLHWLLSGFFFC